MESASKVRKVNRGVILENFPQISIDKFDAIQQKQCSFFLTHYDDEILNELLNGSFFQRLADETNSSRLYLHSIVFQLLKYWTTTSHYDNTNIDGQDMVDQLNELFECGKIILLQATQVPAISIQIDQVLLTPLSSGSNAGCIMLLIETEQERILYTGACRLTVKDLQSYLPLHNNDGSVKKFDKIYLDTTYCIQEVLELPSRSSVIQNLAKYVNKHLEHDERKQFEFSTSRDMKISNLFCMIKLAQMTSQKIHVPFELENFLQDLDCARNVIDCETTSSTRIHYDCAESCDNEECSPNHKLDFLDNYEVSAINVSCSLSPFFGDGPVRINPITIDHFQSQKMGNSTYTTHLSDTESIHGIYSNHLSFNEMGRLLNYLNVYPTLWNVFPLFVRNDLNEDEISSALEYAIDAKPANSTAAETLPSWSFDFTNEIIEINEN